MADGDSLLGYDPSQDLYGGLLNPTQRNNAGMQQIIATLGAMGAAGQPSRLPVPLGVAAGHGALAGQEAGNRAAQLYGQMNLLAPEITLKRLQALQMQQDYDYFQRYMQGQQQQGQNQQAPQPTVGIPGQQLPAALTPPQGAHLLPLISQLENSKDSDVSNKGAVGRYQITPDTARTYGFDPAQLKDPAYNERAASAIVDNLSRRYNGDIDPILIGYNAGPGVADKWLASGRDDSILPKETQNYLARAPQLANQPLRAASNGPLSAGGGAQMPAQPPGYAIGAGIPGIPNDPVIASMLARRYPALAGIVKNNFPGPTDFARAVQDYQNAVGTPYEDAARQRLAVATGDRYDISRRGWAVDRLNPGHIFHLPEMGTGVTADFDPATGQTTARVVPGAPEAETIMKKAGAKGEKSFTPATVYGAFGQGYQTTESELPDILNRNNGLNNNGVPRPFSLPPNMGLGGAVPSGRTSLESAPSQTPASSGARGTPVSSVPIPVQTPSGTKDITQLSLDDLFPGGKGIPMPPAPPPGAGYGKPNEATTARQKTDNDLAEGYTKEAAENQGLYQSIAHVRDIVQGGFNSNELAPFMTKLTNVAQGMGMTDLVKQFKEYDPNDAAAFQKASTLMVFALVKKFQGQVRVAEITGSQKASPDMTIPPAANLGILSDMLAIGKTQDVRAPLAQRYITETGGAPLSAFNEAFNKVAPLDTVTSQLRQHLRESGGWTFPGDPGTPSGGPVAPYTKLKTPPSESDIRNTALKYGIPVSEVKKRLGIE